MTGASTLPVHHRWRDHCVLEAEQLDVYALAVVTALHVHMRDGVATVGLRRLAEVARCTVGTVRARIAVLERAGLLEVHQGQGRRRTTYVATLPADAALLAEPDEGDVDPDEVCRPTTRGVSPDDTPDPEEVCHPTTQGVSPDDTQLCHRTTHVSPTPVEPLRARARVREAPPGRRPGPTSNRAPMPWQVEEHPDGTLWVRQVAS